MSSTHSLEFFNCLASRFTSDKLLLSYQFKCLSSTLFEYLLYSKISLSSTVISTLIILSATFGQTGSVPTHALQYRDTSFTRGLTRVKIKQKNWSKNVPNCFTRKPNFKLIENAGKLLDVCQKAR